MDYCRLAAVSMLLSALFKTFTLCGQQCVELHCVAHNVNMAILYMCLNSPDMRGTLRSGTARCLNGPVVHAAP